MIVRVRLWHADKSHNPYEDDAMTQSSLAYLSAAFKKALEREGQNPTVPAHVKRQAWESANHPIAGFPVYDRSLEKKIINDAPQERREKISRYYSGCETLRCRLSDVGITPLAFVPLKAWNDLCQLSGLIQLCPDRDNTVRVSTEHFRETQERVEFAAETMIPYTLLFGITAALVSIGASKHGFDWRWFLTWSTLSFICTLVMLRLMYSADAVSSRLLRRAFARKPYEEIVRAFFPGGVEVEDRDACRTEVRFPDPHERIAETLIALQRLGTDIHIAVVPQAVCFLKSLEDILLGAKKPRDEKALVRRLQAARKLEFIIYIVDETTGVVAVVTYFGKFPIEQELIDRVVNSEQLI